MLIGYILIIGLVGFDQLTKVLALIFKNDNTSLIKTLIPNVLEFHFIENTGASFGMLEDAQFFFAIITIFSLIVFGFLFYESNFKTKKVYSIGIALIIAGSFGNAIDRLFRDGAVIDMVNMPILNSFLDIFKISDFIFNIADLYMTAGIILFVIDILFLESKRVDKNERKNEHIIIE